MLALERYPSTAVRDGIPDRPIVLLGSLGSTRRMWRPQRQTLQSVGPVIEVDLRGHGDSQVLDCDVSMADLARDVVVALDQLGVARAHFVGLSLGGAICQQLAVEYPQRVDHLVLCSTAPKFGTPDMWTERAELVRREGPAVLLDGVIPKWFTAPFVAAHGDVIRRIRQDFAATAAPGYARACQALASFDIRDRLADIAAPTLVVAGTEDGSTPPDVVREVAETIPGARWELLDRCAHMLTIERAEAANALLRDHFGQAREHARRAAGRAPAQ